MKKIIQHAAFILVLSIVIGLSVNVSMIRRSIKGEFSQGFLSQEEFSAITFITLAEAEDLFSQQAAVFIDSRNTEEFRRGHILGAINLPFTEEEKAALTEELPFGQEANLVIYCDGSECRSSVELGRLLYDRGYASIRVFFGGWSEWLAAGLPVITEEEYDRK